MKPRYVAQSAARSFLIIVCTLAPLLTGCGAELPAVPVDQTISALALSQAIAQAQPLQQWTVERIRIPAQSDIAAAYVNLRTTEGRALTMTKGEISREGVRLERVQWFGSPVGVKVHLRRGHETAVLETKASLVAKDDKLQAKEAAVACEVKFFEVPKALAAQLPILSGHVAKREPAPSHAPLLGVLAGKELAALLATLAQHPDVRSLTGTCQTAPGDTHRIVRLLWPPQPVPTGARQPDEDPAAKREAGLFLSLSANLSYDGTVDLGLGAQLVEYQKALPPSASVADLTAGILHSTKANQVYVSVFSGMGIALGNIDPAGTDFGVPPIAPGHVPLVIVVAQPAEAAESPR